MIKDWIFQNWKKNNPEKPVSIINDHLQFINKQWQVANKERCNNVILKGILRIYWVYNILTKFA